jgi:antitoxin component HigA of HigAB toxin-antitoxin module
MSTKPIRTRVEHERALTEIERLMGAKRGSPQADRLEVPVIRKLAKEWDIPTDILVQPYRLEGQGPSRAA